MISFFFVNPTICVYDVFDHVGIALRKESANSQEI